MYVQTLITSLLILLATVYPRKEWKMAEKIAESRRTEWYAVFEDFELEQSECEAIVFPELLRWSSFQDKVQIGALIGLYVSAGKKAADFSVGCFQMKPSFAEDLEKEWMERDLGDEWGLYFSLADDSSERRRRVQRLREEKWQCVYLSMFIRVMLVREPELEQMDAEARLRLLAAAYNRGFMRPMAEIEAQSRVSSFHLELVRLKSTKLYNYSQLAVRRYKSLKAAGL